MEKENGDTYAAIEAETERLAQRICIYAPHDGIFSQSSKSMPELFVGRHSKICFDNIKTIYSPCLLVAAQGKLENHV
ncbi:MAG: hypothetical protein LBK73_14865 [Treponema sp.]|jgi:hypothetical protein|nr:hypothetical protein [Treponema sp.]